MTMRKRRSGRSGRKPLPSPGRPPVAGRDERRQFWAAIAAGLSSEDAGAAAGVPEAVGAVGCAVVSNVGVIGQNERDGSRRDISRIA